MKRLVWMRNPFVIGIEKFSTPLVNNNKIAEISCDKNFKMLHGQKTMKYFCI